MNWKRKGNNHELFVNDKKVASISGHFISGPTNDCCDSCTCDWCHEPTIIEYDCYYFGKKLGTCSNIENAKKEVEFYVKANHA